VEFIDSEYYVCCSIWSHLKAVQVIKLYSRVHHHVCIVSHSSRLGSPPCFRLHLTAWRIESYGILGCCDYNTLGNANPWMVAKYNFRHVFNRQFTCFLTHFGGVHKLSRSLKRNVRKKSTKKLWKMEFSVFITVYLKFLAMCLTIPREILFNFSGFFHFFLDHLTLFPLLRKHFV
jgi:hypothetical protein